MLLCTLAFAGCGSPKGTVNDAGVGSDSDADASVDSSDDLIQPSSCAGAGTLDPGFGVGGVAPEVFGFVPSPLAGASSVVIESATQRIIVAGAAPRRDNRSGLALVRFTVEGQLDPSFGDAGIVLDGIDEHDTWLNDVVIQSDGKILAAGGISGADGVRVLLARYSADGIRDTSFGSSGLVITSLAPYSYAASLALSTTGDILVSAAGLDGTSAGDPQYMITAAFHADGTPQLSFGTGGIAQPAFDNGLDVPNQLAVGADNSVLVVGQAASPDEDIADFGVARYLPDGTLDASFSGDGLRTIEFGGGSIATGAVIDSLGRATIVGDVSTGPGLVRVLPSGDLDETFGTDGLVIVGTDGLTFQKAALSAVDDTLIVAGWLASGTARSFALARFDASGVLDSSFGGNGLVTTASSTRDLALDLAVQLDGKVVVAGQMFAGAPSQPLSDFRVARYCP